MCRKDEKEYALKQIEGTGISMSACREIAVSGYKYSYLFYYWYWVMIYFNIKEFHLYIMNVYFTYV